MNKVLLIYSHFGADSESLCRLLDKHPRIQWFKKPLVFDDLEALNAFTQKKHKAPSKLAIWMTQVLENHYFSHKGLCKVPQFIYVARSAKPTLSALITKEKDCGKMLRYYTLRLRRIYEMARKTEGNSVFVTWDEMAKGMQKIEDFLKIKLAFNEKAFAIPASNPYLDAETLKEGEQFYNEFYRLMRCR